MSSKLPTSDANGKTTPVVTSKAARNVDRFLDLLRQAMSETNYSIDALSASIEEVIGRPVDRSNLWRMLNGERPLPLSYLLALPLDLKARLAQRSAEACGLIVVQPASPTDAGRQLVAGLLGVLQYGLPVSRTELPSRADAMATATIADQERKSVA